MKIWAKTKEFFEGKYLVVRRDGSVPAWPHFVLGARDPCAPEALRAYAFEAKARGLDEEFVDSVYELASDFEAYRAAEGNGDPNAPPHRKDDPNIVAAMCGERLVTPITVWQERENMKKEPPAQEAPKPAPMNNLTTEHVDAFVQFPTLDMYQSAATKSAIYPGKGTPLGLAYVALKMNGEAGEFAEHVGKAMRDDGLTPLDSKGGAVARLDQKLTPERRELLIKEIGDVLWYLSAACNELDISLSEAAATNLEKLAGRTARGTLGGSGDNR